MILLIWTLVFIVSVCALIKAADWLVLGLQRVSRIVGIREADISLPAALVAVAMPEMAAAIAAVLQGRGELAVALVIGSSIVNILLVTGLSALSARSLLLKKEHIESDLPLFAASVAAFCFIAFDGRINALEGTLLILMFFTYIVYAYSSRSRRGFTARDVITPELLGTSAAARIVQMLPTRLERKLEAVSGSGGHSLLKAGVFLFGGAALLVVAANLTVSSLLGISDNENLAISAALAAMIVLSIGTAMPELFGSMSVVRDRKGELTLGNLFAATIANLLLVCGVASLFTPLVFGGIVLSVGLPFLALAAVLLTIAAITGRISSAQGMLFLLLYFLFFVKLLELF